MVSKLLGFGVLVPSSGGGSSVFLSTRFVALLLLSMLLLRLTSFTAFYAFFSCFRMLSMMPTGRAFLPLALLPASFLRPMLS